MWSYTFFICLLQEHVFLCDPEYYKNFIVCNGARLIIFIQTSLELIHLLISLSSKYVPGIMLVLQLQQWAKSDAGLTPSTVHSLQGASHLILSKNSPNPQLPIKSKLLSLVFKLYHHEAQACSFNQLIFNSSPTDIVKFPTLYLCNFIYLICSCRDTVIYPNTQILPTL